MSDEKTFTDGEIEEAIEYLVGQDFNRPQDRALEGQRLFTRQANDENVSMVVIVHSNNSIKYDVSSGGGEEDYPVDVGEINSLEELHLKVAEVIG